ncbi:MAG: FAD-dependent oxidoreductase [Chloroflexota bacterium]
MVKVRREAFAVPACVESCPAGIDVPRYIRCIKQGKFAEALAVVRERLPLPVVCAHACLAPCEDACAYKQFGEPIAIRALKRFAVSHGTERWKKKRQLAAKTGRKIAIVGAGPAGLTAAYYLLTLGHEVTIYDSLPKPGGTLRYGIPHYRLPEEELDRDIKEITDLGVIFKLNTIIGKDISLAELKKQYDAVFLAAGANKSVRIDLEGAEKTGVLWGLEFLRDIALGKKVVTKDDVIVIGGGNVAIDVALTAKRLGAKKVSVVCLEKEEEMPALDWEVARAKEEGVTIYNSWGPARVKGDKNVESVEFVKCTSVFDKAGNFKPIYDEKTTKTLPAGCVILAIGQAADLDFLGKGNGVKANGRAVRVDEQTLATDEAGIFAGGDIVTGPTSIIAAVAQGRKAAVSIDKYLGGRGVIEEKLATQEKEVELPEFVIEAKSRSPMPLLDVEDRIDNFEQIEEGFSKKQAVAEAGRCLACDARRFEVVVYPDNCKECGYCLEVCQLKIAAPSNNYNAKGYRPVAVKDATKCVGCLKCFFACPDYAIDVRETSGLNGGGA